MSNVIPFTKDEPYSFKTKNTTLFIPILQYPQCHIKGIPTSEWWDAYDGEYKYTYCITEINKIFDITSGFEGNFIFPRIKPERDDSCWLNNVAPELITSYLNHLFFKTIESDKKKHTYEFLHLYNKLCKPTEYYKVILYAGMLIKEYSGNKVDPYSKISIIKFNYTFPSIKLTKDN